MLSWHWEESEWGDNSYLALSQKRTVERKSKRDRMEVTTICIFKILQIFCKKVYFTEFLLKSSEAKTQSGVAIS